MKRTVCAIFLVMTIITAAFICPALAESPVYGSGGWRYCMDGGNAAVISYEGSGSNLTVPESIEGHPVTSVGNGLYSGIPAFRAPSVAIPGSVTSIGDNAFRGCTSVMSVSIPDSVTSVGIHAFRRCLSLTSVVIPDSVSSIGRSAFSDCISLTSAVISGSVTSIEDYTFGGCSSLISVRIPDSVVSIGKLAFADCTSLTSAVIPESVTSFGDDIFHNCGSLVIKAVPGSAAEQYADENGIKHVPFDTGDYAQTQAAEENAEENGAGLLSGDRSPGPGDLEEAGYAQMMQLPDEKSYLPEYEDMYVDIAKTNVYLYTKAGSSVIGDTLEYGAKVTAIAVQKTMTCVIYTRSDGRYRAGWITSENLRYPGVYDAGPAGTDSASPDISRPGPDVIRYYGEEKNVQLPDESSYLPDYATMYVRISSANVYSYTKAGSARVACTLGYRDEVTVIAVQKTMSCILYETSGGTVHVGWITSENLSYDLP